MAKKHRYAAPASTAVVVRQAAPIRRRRAGAVVRRVAHGARRAASAVAGQAAIQRHDLTAIGGAAALGFAEQKQMNIPTVGGFDPALVWGAGLGFLLPMLMKGKGKGIVRTARALGIGVGCVGVHRSIVRGSAKVSGDDDGTGDYY